MKIKTLALSQYCFLRTLLRTLTSQRFALLGSQECLWKRYLALTMIVLLQLIFGIEPASAAVIRFNPDANSTDGLIVGRVFLNRLGGISLPHGRALFRGNSIDITIVPEFQFDRVVVLSGAILDVHPNISGQQAMLTGTVYFFDGDWLRYIDDPQTADSIVTTSGTIIGRIRGINANALELEETSGSRKSIPLAAMTSVRSPRAFEFKLPSTAISPPYSGKPFTLDATELSLRPSGNPFQLKALKHDRLMQNDGDLSTSKLILIGAAYSTAQLAQMVPFLLIPLDGKHMVTRANQTLNEFFSNSNFQSQNGLLTPIPPPGFHNFSPGG